MRRLEAVLVALILTFWNSTGNELFREILDAAVVPADLDTLVDNAEEPWHRDKRKDRGPTRSPSPALKITMW